MDQQLEEGLYKKCDDVLEQHPPSHHTSWMCVLAIGIITVIGLIQYSAIVLVEDE
jgi:hypothetical protein